MSQRDYRDVVIETLAESEAALLDQIATLADRAVHAEADREAYRLIAVQAIHHICGLRAESDSTTERYHRSLEDARGLRVRLLQADAQVAA